MKSPAKVVVVATHPIQHFCPQYRSLSQRDDIELRVVFWSMKGLETYEDPGFGRQVDWGQDLVSGFDWVDAGESQQRATEALNEFAPDLVVAYGYRTPAARAGWRWTRGKPATRLAYIADTEMRHREAWFKRGFKRAAMRVLFRRVDIFLTVGDANEAFYRACGVANRQMVRMHFPIDREAFGSLEVSTEDLRQELGIAQGALVVLTVGKFIERKRQADLVEAMNSFGPNEAHLILAGSGPEESALRKLADGQTNITFTGFVDPGSLPALYATADVYAHVSDMDPHPLSVSEAAAAGCALLVSDRVGSWGPTDDVRPNVTGVVVPTGDVPALRAALAAFASDRAMTAAYGCSSQQWSARHQALAHGGFVEHLVGGPVASGSREV